MSLPILLAIAIANLPEGLASGWNERRRAPRSLRLRGLGRGGLASLLGYLLLRDAPRELIAFITTIATLGFLAEFILSHLG